MYRENSISRTSDYQRLVNTYFTMIHWSVMIFIFNIILYSSITCIHQNTFKFIHRHKYGFIYVCVTAIGSCLQSRDPIRETEVLFLRAVTS